MREARMIKLLWQQGRGLWLALFLRLLPAQCYAEPAPPGLTRIDLDRRSSI